ncbi:tetratricopeptide repeat protein [Pectinatus frisingensis]|uniref:tetratricopeptide repeat protein n=1 Tax=Pectinatus frisingensis TaxID=865 RepID=UPI0018C81D25|nr:hypothetical protein [Pectinatus frisingensis]
MGKNKKRIMKNRRREIAVKNLQYSNLKSDNINSKTNESKYRQEIKVLIEEKKYNAAMEKIISLFDAGHTDYDLMFDLAEIYYATRDYQRAEKWAFNSLKTRETGKPFILLAQIYSDNNDTEKMAGALNEALRLSDDVSDTDSELLDDMLLVVELAYDADIIAEKYPYIAKKMEEDEAGIDMDLLSEGDKEQQDNTTEGLDEEAAVDNDKTDNTKLVTDDESLQSAQSAADSIEQMINAELAKDSGQKSADNTEQPSAQTAAQVTDNNIIDDSAPVDESAIETIRTGILQEDTSLTDKIKKLNAVAAKYYFDDDFISAQVFLETAFSIDACDEGTLRNLVQISLRQNDKEKAIDYAIRMPVVDFTLLDKIKNN